MATKWKTKAAPCLMAVLSLGMVISVLQTVTFSSTTLYSACPHSARNANAKVATTVVRQMHRNTTFKDSRLEVKDYVIAPDANFCVSSEFVVIVAVKAEDDVRRDEWRSTYARPELKRKYKYGLLFAVGLPRSHKAQEKLLLESQLHGDIVQTDSEDFSVTIKVLNAIRLVVSYCGRTKAIVKIDDDAAWNIARTKNLVLRHLKHDEIYGQVDPHPRPHRVGPWNVTKEEWSRNDYPLFCRGMAYVIPLQAAQKILSVVPFQQFLKLEDVFITGVLTEAANVTVSHLGKDGITLVERHPGMHKEVNSTFLKINGKHHLHWFWKVNGDMS